MNHQQAYKLLQLNPSSTEKEIKQAYRKYAMLYHPDRNHNSNAYQKFIDVSEAYELLSNKQNIYINNPKPKNQKQNSKFRSSEHKYRNYQSYNSKKESLLLFIKIIVYFFIILTSLISLLVFCNPTE